MAQRSKVQTKRPQPRHVFMYTKRHIPRNDFRQQRQYVCDCVGHMNAKTHAPRVMYIPPTHNMPHRINRTNMHNRNNGAYVHRPNRFANIRCFYCMTFGTLIVFAIIEDYI